MGGHRRQAADSTYLPGKRSHSWIKIKNFRDLEVVIVGWKPGAGRREGSLGSLLLAVPDADRNLRYAGKVGTGFTDTILDQLMTALEPLRSRTSAVADSVPRADALGADLGGTDPRRRGQVRRMDARPAAAGDQLAWAAPGQVAPDLESNLLPERSGADRCSCP